MSKLRVHSFTISLDGYGAGPDQSLENPLGVGGEGAARMGVRHPHFPSRCSDRRAARPASTTSSQRAASTTSAPGSWAATCSGPIRGRLAGRCLEGMVGRRSAVSLPGVRAHPSSARPDRHGGRHHLPLRHRRHPRGAEARDRSRQPARTSASAAASPPSGNTCRQGSSTRCILPSRRSCSAPASTFSPGSICQSSDYRRSEHVTTPNATHVVLTR